MSSVPEDHESSGDVADLEAAVEQTREQLTETVDALAAKADVTGRAKAKAAELKEQAANSLLDDRGQVRPVVPIGATAAVVVVIGLVVLTVRRRRR